jgi:Tfp pilus assembly protein PilX
MKIKMKKNGSVLLIVVFTIALLTAFVIGMLEMNTEQIQIMKNEIFAAQARAIAEAGMADAFGRIRTSSALPGNFNSSFGGGSYAVTIAGSLPDANITSEGTSPQGFKASVRADITVDTTNSCVIRVDQLRINE